MKRMTLIFKWLFIITLIVGLFTLVYFIQQRGLHRDSLTNTGKSITIELSAQSPTSVSSKLPQRHNKNAITRNSSSTKNVIIAETHPVHPTKIKITSPPPSPFTWRRNKGEVKNEFSGDKNATTKTSSNNFTQTNTEDKYVKLLKRKTEETWWRILEPGK